jgi:hypothetical protein
LTPFCGTSHSRDDDLKALREHDDFKKLVAGLEKGKN